MLYNSNSFAKIRSIIFLLSFLLITGCGEGCKYPDEEGEWENLNKIAVPPINIDVLDGGASSIILKDNTTEKSARRNLWFAPKLENGDSFEDAIVTSGLQMKITIDKNSSVTLKGVNDTFQIRTKRIANQGGIYYQKDKINSITGDKSFVEDYGLSDEDGLHYKQDKTGIIPMKGSRISVKPGQKIQINISPAIFDSRAATVASANDSSATYQTLDTNWPMVQSIGCTSGNASKCDEYIPLKNGHGLYVYITPQSKELKSSGKYVDPEQWQCNLGSGGSNNYYRFADYSVYNDIVPDIPLRDLVKNLFVTVSTNATQLPPKCSPEKKLWSSGSNYFGYNIDDDNGSVDIDLHKYTMLNITGNSRDVVYQFQYEDYMDLIEQDGDYDKVFSRLGPFSGMQVNSYDRLLPMLSRAKLNNHWYILPQEIGLSFDVPNQDKDVPKNSWRAEMIYPDSPCALKDGEDYCATWLRYFRLNSSDYQLKMRSLLLRQNNDSIYLSSTIKKFTDDKYFQRCVTNWRMPNWMLLETGEQDESSNSGSDNDAPADDSSSTTATPLRYVRMFPNLENDTNKALCYKKDGIIQCCDLNDNTNCYGKDNIGTCTMVDNQIQTTISCDGATNGSDTAGFSDSTGYIKTTGYLYTSIDNDTPGANWQLDKCFERPEDLAIVCCKAYVGNNVFCTTSYNLANDNLQADFQALTGSDSSSAGGDFDNFANVNKPWLFKNGFDGISGSYFLSSSLGTSGLQSSIASIKTKYEINDIHARYGGMVSNVLYDKNAKSATFYPDFKIPYNRAIILLKNISNDPLNAHRKECEITVSSGSNDRITKLISNEPYGNMKDLTNPSGDPEEYWQDTLIYRNLVGSGIIQPKWHQVMDDSSKTMIFNKGESVKIEPENESFYSSGWLSSKDKRNKNGDWGCSTYNGDHGYESALWSCFLASPAATPVLSLIPGLGQVAIIGAGMACRTQVPILQAMAAADYNGNIPDMSPDDDDKRQCGTGVAFRVLPISPAACIGGYRLYCSNERINSYVNTRIDSRAIKINTADEYIKTLCRQTTSDGNNTPLGRCMKREYNIQAINNKLSEYPQKYSSSTMNINMITNIDNSSEWTDVENIQENHCGLCVPNEHVYSNGGINYITINIDVDKNKLNSLLEAGISTAEQCASYKGTSKDIYLYKWIENYAYVDVTLQQSEKDYVMSEYFALYNDITFFEPDTYVDNDKLIGEAWAMANFRNSTGCIAAIKRLYGNYTDLIQNDDAKKIVTAKYRDLANSVSTELLKRAKLRYDKMYRFQFNANEQYGACSDPKDAIHYDSSNKYFSLASFQSDALQYGAAELTEIQGSGSGIYEMIIPKKLLDKSGNEISFNKADLNFVFAPSLNRKTSAPITDVMNQYSVYKSGTDINSALLDETRGYQVSVGDGTPIKNGKYLYLYIQPLDQDGEPDVKYNPNTVFSPDKSNPISFLQMTKYPFVYSFRDFDQNADGFIKITTPKTGKLWYSVLDVFESDPLNPDQNLNVDTDGKMIIFTNESDTVVKNQNYLGFNSGAYVISTRIQTSTSNYTENFINSVSPIDLPISTSMITNIFNATIVQPIKTIMMGKWDNDKKDYEWEDGVIYKVATLLTRQAFVQILYYLAVVISVFVFAFEFLTGQAKFSLADIRKYMVNFALITTFGSPGAWNLYQKFFVKGAFDIVEGLSIMVAGNFASGAFLLADQRTFVDVGFGPINEVFSFIFSTTTLERLLAILFSSILGFVPCLVIMMSFMIFMMAAISGIIMYVFVLITMSLNLCLGPLIFIMLVHPATSGKFTEWWKGIASLISQQVFLFCSIGIFGILYLNITKGMLDFPICWEPIIKIPILNITLFSMWRVSGTVPPHMLNLMGESAPNIASVPSVNLASGLVLILISMTMLKFCNQAAQLGASVFGGNPVGDFGQGGKIIQGVTGGIGDILKGIFGKKKE